MAGRVPLYIIYSKWNKTLSDISTNKSSELGLENEKQTAYSLWYKPQVDNRCRRVTDNKGWTHFQPAFHAREGLNSLFWTHIVSSEHLHCVKFSGLLLTAAPASGEGALDGNGWIRKDSEMYRATLVSTFSAWSEQGGERKTSRTALELNYRWGWGGGCTRQRFPSSLLGAHTQTLNPPSSSKLYSTLQLHLSTF